MVATEFFGITVGGFVVKVVVALLKELSNSILSYFGHVWNSF